MDINTYLTSLANQLSALKDSASAVLGADHFAVTVINDSYTAITLNGLEVHAPVVPQGFTDATYDDFLQEQASVLGNRTGEVVDVVGLIPDANGNLVEVGDAENSFAQAREAVADIEAEAAEFDEDVEVEESVTVTYTRLNDQELTVADVHSIINHPISKPLERFGAIQLVTVRDGDTPAEKRAVFAVLEEGDLPLQALALNIAAYKGVMPFPGLGNVQAVGSVNFID